MGFQARVARDALSQTHVGGPRSLKEAGGADRWRWGGPVPGELAMGSRVVSLERDPLGGDGELPDLGLVQAGSGLQHGQGASHLRLVA
jgi:hypothetical protein